MADKETPLPSVSLGQYHHKTGTMPRIIVQHPSEHSVVRESQNNYNTRNKNHISEVRHTLFWRRTCRILSQRSGHPFNPIRFCHRALSRNSIPGKNNDHWAMVQQFFPLVHLGSNQRPNQRHQWTHGVYPRLLHNIRIRSHIPHPGPTRSTIPQDKYAARNHKNHYFLSLATALKWSPRKEHPRQFIIKL